MNVYNLLVDDESSSDYDYYDDDCDLSASMELYVRKKDNDDGVVLSSFIVNNDNAVEQEKQDDNDAAPALTTKQLQALEAQKLEEDQLNATKIRCLQLLTEERDFLMKKLQSRINFVAIDQQKTNNKYCRITFYDGIISTHWTFEPTYPLLTQVSVVEKCLKRESEVACLAAAVVRKTVAKQLREQSGRCVVLSTVKAVDAALSEWRASLPAAVVERDDKPKIELKRKVDNDNNDDDNDDDDDDANVSVKEEHEGDVGDIKLMYSSQLDDEAGVSLIGKAARAKKIRLSNGDTTCTNIYNHSATIVGTKLYVIGDDFYGIEDTHTQRFRQVRVLDLLKRKWSFPTVPHVGKLGFTRAVRLKKTIFVFSSIRGVLCFDCKTMKFTKIKTRTFPVGFTATRVGHFVWLIGGYESKKHRSKLFALFNLFSHSFDLLNVYKLQAFPHVGGHSATKVGRHIFLHGGRDAGFVSNESYVVDTVEKTLTKLNCARDCAPRHGHEAVLIDRFLTVLGGGGYGSDSVDRVDVFDCVEQQWLARDVHGAMLGRTNFTATNVGGTILILGGFRRKLNTMSSTRPYGSQQYSEQRTPQPTYVFDVGCRAASSASNLTAYMAKMLKSGLYSDVFVTVDNETFDLHKVVLRARCPAFLTALLEDRQAIEIKLKPHLLGFKVLLQYIYCDERGWINDAKLFDVLGIDKRKQSEELVPEDIFDSLQECVNICGMDVLSTALAQDLALRKKRMQIMASTGDDGRLISINRAMAHLFDSAETSSLDSDFVCVDSAGAERQLHTLFLSRAPFFTTMLSSGMKEAVDGRLTVGDVAPASLKALLRFLYCDKLNVEPEHAVEILRLADRFGIGSLKHNATVLIEAYYDLDDVESVLYLFDVAVQYNADRLKQTCLRLIDVDFSRAQVMQLTPELLSARSAKQLDDHMNQHLKLKF